MSLDVFPAPENKTAFIFINTTAAVLCHRVMALLLRECREVLKQSWKTWLIKLFDFLISSSLSGWKALKG